MKENLTVGELIEILTSVDSDMEIVIRNNDIDLFEIEINKSYDPVLKKTLLVLEASN